MTTGNEPPTRRYAVSQLTDVTAHFSQLGTFSFLKIHEDFQIVFEEWECITAIRGQENKLKLNCKCHS